MWRTGLALTLVLAAGGLRAAPEDDHKRALQSYQRGDVVAAINALRPAAKAGHAPSMTMLAFILDRSDFIDEALALYQGAATQGDAEGHSGLANYFLIGRAVAKDEKRAFEHFSKAADLGHAGSIEIVAEAHLNRRLGGQELNSDDAAIVAALRRAAAQGHLRSVDALAQAHQAGRWGLAADATAAASWQSKAAELRKQRGLTPAKAVKK